jgi:hypothetical protein
MGSTDTLLEQDHSRTTFCIWNNFGFIPFSCSEEDFQRFPIFQPIRGHDSHFECRARSPYTVFEEYHPMCITSKFGPVIVEKIKIQIGNKTDIN